MAATPIQTQATPDEPPSGRPVVTRFAPSPTGFLHIGGARTALYNWLFARRYGGTFVLRIEDTDRARSTDAAVAAILDGMAWLGLDWDGQTVFQSHREARHREAVLDLVARGGAYRCYLSEAETEAEKSLAREEKRAFRSPWRSRTDGDPSLPHTVRLKAGGTGGDVLVRDAIHGAVTFEARQIDDFILLRSDGTPTYMLAVVVDDHDMGITHVIRGDDHLTNAGRQVALIEAFGWPVPIYAHIPLIHGDDGKKLSKRHGALGVEEYRAMGYLPESLRAYLLRLGWSHGDLDIVDDATARSLFDLAGLGKSPARLDFAKLGSVNNHFLRAADPHRVADLILGQDVAGGSGGDGVTRQRLVAAASELTQRATTVPELAEQAEFLTISRPFSLLPGAQKQLTAEARPRLEGAAKALASADAWRHDALKDTLASYAADEGVGFGKIGPLVRAALTGGRPAPDLGLALEWLGRDESLARLNDALEQMA